MTICIAAKTADGCIVTVSDRRVSYLEDGRGDYFEATEEGVQKVTQLTKNWGLLASFNSPNAVPDLIKDIRSKLSGHPETNENVRATINSCYLEAAQKQIVGKYLAIYGINTIEKFRKSGLKEFGADFFHSRLNLIEQFELGIYFLVFGFDAENENTPHIFEINAAGQVLDCDMMGFGVIGSGYFPAFATLTARGFNAFRNVEDAVYRLCEAKFAAGTSTGVGPTTTVVIFQPGIEPQRMHSTAIADVKAVWESERNRAVPKKAKEIIHNQIVLLKDLQRIAST